MTHAIRIAAIAIVATAAALVSTPAHALTHWESVILVANGYIIHGYGRLTPMCGDTTDPAATAVIFWGTSQVWWVACND